MKRVIIEVISALLMILFLYTGVSKLIEFTVFEEQLRESIFKPIASIMAWALPVTEIVGSFLLLIPKWKLRGLYFSLLLMAAFTVYVIWLVSFTDDLPCSCGGVIQELSWTQHIIFNCVFLGFAILGIWLYKKLLKEENKLKDGVVTI